MQKKFIGNSGEIVKLYKNKAIKYIGTQSPDKFYLQQKFLHDCKHPNFIKISNIKWMQSYEMPYYKKSYLDFILKNDDKTNIKKFKELLDIVLKYGICKGHNTVFKNYFDKLEKRVPYKFDLNGCKFDLYNLENFVHGDLTISNILLDDEDNFVFIDTRGTLESIYYDWGKLMQSFVMKYESLLHGVNYDLSIYDKFVEIMFEELDHDHLYFYLAVHLLGAVPFFRKNNRSYTDLFLEKGLEIFDMLGIKYEKLS